MNPCSIFGIIAKPWFLSTIKMGDCILKFDKILWRQNFFLHLWRDKPLWAELKLCGGIHFHYFISLETASKKSKVLLLRVSSGNVNASEVVTCRYTQI